MNTETKPTKLCIHTSTHTNMGTHTPSPPSPYTLTTHTGTHTQNHVHTYTYLWSVPAWGCVQTRARSCSQRTLACFHWSKGCPPCRGTPPSYPHARPGVPPALCPSVPLLAGCRKLECPVKRQNIHVHTHTYIYIYISLSLCLSIYIYTHIYIYKSTHTQMHEHTPTNTHTPTWTHTLINSLNTYWISQSHEAI